MNELNRAEVLSRVESIMRRDLKLGDDIVIDPSMPFIGGEADIDSLDVLLLLSSVEREFGIKIASAEMGKELFQNVGTLVDYLTQNVGKSAEVGGAAVGADADVLGRLPHGPPFRFVSKLLEREADRSARGVWSVSGKEDFLAGHFPGRPLVPGVLIAEALAQLCGLAASMEGLEGRLAKVDVRFDAAVTPPAEIELRSRVERRAGAVIQYAVEAAMGGKIVASGIITLGWTGGGEA